MIKTTHKTLCCVRVHGADQLKQTLTGTAWAHHFMKFLTLCAQSVQAHRGAFVRSLGDGVVVAFEHAEYAVQAAIDLQEIVRDLEFDGTAAISCKIGVASGPVAVLSLEGKEFDVVGEAVNIAERLCDRAHGNAILLHHPLSDPSQALAIHSKRGRQQARTQAAYFLQQPPCQLRAIKETVQSYAIFWQETPGNYLTSRASTECHPSTGEIFRQEATCFGRVTTFKRERGFGFIQYYDDDQTYKEIYFHMTYVVNQAPINENDHVQFVIKPGKEGRPQACSVLVMGSRLFGQVESLEANGSGHISIRNQASEVIRFFILPQFIQNQPLQISDIVEFTVGSGSDDEGLVAIDMTLHRGDNVTVNQEYTSFIKGGDDLTLGATEQAVMTVYFTEKGYGFAKCRRNNIYVHISELTDPEQIPSPGDLIEFEVTPGRDRTYRANNIRILQRKTSEQEIVIP